MENGKVIKMIINDFKDIGYDVSYKILNLQIMVYHKQENGL